jgi:pSer/pThr/pTyr-binding forkhead associated (FHA) protein
MDSAAVVITLVDDRRGEARFVYNQPWICLVGRARDCDIFIPSDNDTMAASRHHCLLEINPPSIRVRDLGSMNGTFVNGQRIGQQTRTNLSRAATADRGAGLVLNDGDEIQIGRTPIRLTISIHERELHEVGSNDEYLAAD